MAINDNSRDEDRQRDPKVARLYQSASGEEPPTAIDAAILAAARREVRAGPQVFGGGARSQGTGGGGEPGTPPVRAMQGKRNWYVPVSIAAVMVLSVSLVTLVHQEKGEQLAQPPVIAGLPSKPSAPPAAPEAYAEVAQKQHAEKVEAAANSAVASGAARKDQPAGAVTREQGPPPAPAREAKATPQPFPAQSPASRDVAEARPRTEADSTARGALQEAPVAWVAPPPPPATSPKAAAATRRSAPLEDAVAPSASPAPSATPAPRMLAKPVLWRGLEDQPPEKWLERLAELRRDNRSADADELLAEFRRRFPDHPSSAR